MYDKILTMEKAMQAEIDQLRQREMDLISCLQKDREELVEEKSLLEKVQLLFSNHTVFSSRYL